MNKKPLITVLMSVYNEKEIWLREAIESILKQSFSNFELIIILDDPHNDLLRKVIKEYQKEDQRIIFLENERNLGPGASKNRGLEIAQGEYIAIMDADDISLPQRFAKQIEFLENNPEIDLLGSWVYKINEKGEKTGIMRMESEPEFLSKIILHKMPAFHSTWLVRGKVFKHLNGYLLSRNAEDAEFIMRVVENGFKISNIQEPLGKYRLRSTQVSQKNALEQAKTSRYLVKLHRERLKTGENSFSEEDLEKAIKSSALSRFLHSRATHYLIKAIEFRDRGIKILSVLLVGVSFLLSPYWIGKRIQMYLFLKKSKVQEINNV